MTRIEPFQGLRALAPYAGVLLVGAALDLLVSDTAALVFLIAGVVALVALAPRLPQPEQPADPDARRALRVGQFAALLVALLAASLAGEDLAIAVGAITLVVASVAARALAAEWYNRRAAGA